MSLLSVFLLALVILGVSGKQEFALQDVQDVLDTFVQRFNAKDTEGLMSMYTADVYRMTPDLDVHVTHEAIRNHYETYFGLGLEFEIIQDPLTGFIYQGKDFAAVDTYETMQLSTGPVNFKSLFAFKREDGELKIVAQIYNNSP